MTCPTCTTPMTDFGIWPQLDTGSQLRQCWKCTKCNKFIKVPVKEPVE